MTTTEQWYRIESSRSNPPWADVMRSGASVPLVDELYAAREKLSKPLLRMREEWLSRVPDGVGTPGWREEMYDPVLAAVAFDFQAQAPDAWAPIEAQLLHDEQYRETRAQLDAVQRLLDRTVDLQAAAAGDGPVPDDVGLLLMGGTRTLDPYVELLGSADAVPLVDRRFVEPLVDAGLTSGWTTADVEFRSRKAQPITTHRLLIVTARVSDQPAAIRAHGPAEQAQDAPVARALRRPHGRMRAVHLSAAAVDVLTSAGLPGLTFTAAAMTAIHP